MIDGVPGAHRLPLRYSSWSWRRAHRRLVHDTFRTVPFYREAWALHGAGPVTGDDVRRRREDLVPLHGGSAVIDRDRGVEVVAVSGRAGVDAVLVVSRSAPSPVRRMPGGPRRVWLPPAGADDPAAGRLVDVVAGVRAGRRFVAVGAAGDLAALRTRLPADARAGLPAVAVVATDDEEPAPAPGALLRDPVLGFLATAAACGLWHLDWRRVHARQSGAGVAVSLLRQRSPRLVDVLLAGPARWTVATCARHGTPVLTP